MKHRRLLLLVVLTSTLSFPPVRAQIPGSPRPVTITATTQTKDYGSQGVLDSTAFTVLDADGDAALPNGETIDAVTLQSNTGVAASTTAAAGLYADELTIVGVTGSNGFEAANYALTLVSGDLIVEPRPVTISLLEQTKIYGSPFTPDGTRFTVLDTDGDASLPNGETIDFVTVTSSTGVAASTTASAGTYVDELAMLAPSGSNGFSAANYALTLVRGDLIVAPRPVFISLLEQTKIYGSPLTPDGTRFTVLDTDGDAALPNGETIDFVTVTSNTGVAASTTASAGTYVDELAMLAPSGSNGFSAANYALTLVRGDLVVAPRPVTISLLEQTKIYGSPFTPDGTRFTVLDTDGDASLPNGETIDFVTVTSSTGVAASTTVSAGIYVDELAMLAPSGSNGFSAANYALTLVRGDLVVAPRPVTISLLEQTKIYGSPLTPDGTRFTVLDTDGDASLPNGETIDFVTVTSSTGVAASTTVSAGIYVDELAMLAPSGSNGFSAANYALTLVRGDLVVAPRPVTISLLEQTKVYGSPFTPDGTRFTVLDTDGDAALPNGETIDFVTVTSSTGVAASTTVSAGTYVDELAMLAPSGSNGFSAANYALTLVRGDLVVASRPVTVSAAAQGKTYGDSTSLDATAFSLLDFDGDAVLPNGEQVDSVDLVSFSGVEVNPRAAVGTYVDGLSIVNLRGSSGFSVFNYAFTVDPGSFEVAPREVTLLAKRQAKAEGTALTLDPTAIAILDRDGDGVLPNGERVRSSGMVSVSGVAADTGAARGLYFDEIQPSAPVIGEAGFDAANYIFTFLPATLAVTADTAAAIVVSNPHDDGPGSLREAIENAPDASLITFDPAVFDGEEGDHIRLAATLVIGSKTLVIDASDIPNGVTLSGQGATRVMLIEAGANVNLRSLHLTEGSTVFAAGLLVSAGASCILENTTIYNCEAAANAGGGLGNLGTTIAINGTFHGNLASFGAGIFNGPGASLDLLNCTVTGNEGLLCCAGIVARGERVYLENTIVAENLAPAGTARDVNDEAGNLSALTSLIGDQTGAAVVFPAGLPNALGSFVGTSESPLDPRLAGLSENGGSGLTRLPLPGSSAIDHGTATASSPLQDALRRPRMRGSNPDIGAVEAGWGHELAGTPVQFKYDITTPGDPVEPFPWNSPDAPEGETADRIIDNTPTTKHLNFLTANAGITVSPRIGSSRLQGLRLTSANDAENRDPVSFLVLGSNRGTDSGFELIATGEIPSFPHRFSTQTLFLARPSAVYRHFRVVFPEVRDPAPGGSYVPATQLAEIELLGSPADVRLRVLALEAFALPGGGTTCTVQFLSKPTFDYRAETSLDLEHWEAASESLRAAGFLSSFTLFGADIFFPRIRESQP